MRYSGTGNNSHTTEINNGRYVSEIGTTTTYAVYIDKIQTADTYIGQVKYTLLHPASEEPALSQPATVGRINYFANASTAEGTMRCQSKDDSGNALTDGVTFKLLAGNFSRTGLCYCKISRW